MKKVMVFGTFDGLHEGHMDFFRQAKQHGDYLIVVVARDKNVKKFKKRLPIKNEKQRLNDIKKVKLVDRTILGDLNNHCKRIIEIKPDIICLGYDQKSFNIELKQELKKMGLGNIKIYKLKALKEEKLHSSIIYK